MNRITHLLFFYFISLPFVFGQNAKTPVFYLPVKQKVYPCQASEYDPVTRYVYDEQNAYILIEEQAKSPVIKKYGSDLRMVDSTRILSPEYLIKDLLISEDKFILCGQFEQMKKDTSYDYDNRFNYYTGFAAIFSKDLKLLKIEKFKNFFPWKVYEKDQLLYMTGEMSQSGSEISGIKLKSFIEFKSNSGEKADRNYPDAAIMKLDQDLKIQKFAHFAIEGNFQDGESISVNQDGFVAFAVNTCILYGPDHHDGNLFLLDDNFRMLWHKQFTDFDLGRHHATVLNLNEKKEVICAVKSYYAINTSVDSLLPAFDSENSEKFKMPFQGLIRYNLRGEVVFKNKSDIAFGNSFSSPKQVYDLTSGSENELRYICFYGTDQENRAGLGYITIKPDGRLNHHPSLPDKIPFIYYYDGNSYPGIWTLLKINKN